MPLWPRVHLRWKEPQAFLRIKDARQRAAMRWWSRPLMILATAGLLIASWYIARFNPEKHPPSLAAALTLALLSSPLLVYFFDWMIRFCPSDVRMSDSRILRLRGSSHRETKYTAIRSFGWRRDGEFDTLVLVEHDRETVIAVPNEKLAGDINRFLLEKQIQLRSLI